MNVTQVYAMPGLPVILPDGISARKTVGAVVVSAWCSMASYAAVVAAAYLYSVMFPKDPMRFKMLVLGCTLLATVDTGANLHWAFEWLVGQWGSIPASGKIPIGFYINCFCCATGTSIVQSFYGWTIWLVSDGNRPLVGAIAACSVIQQGVMIWALVKWGVNDATVANMGMVEPGSYGWLIASIIGDTLICGALIYYLKLKPRATINTTTSISFDCIISRAVQSNAISLFCQAAMFVLFRANVGLYFFLTPVILTKVYVFSLLTSLNARRSPTALFYSLGAPQTWSAFSRANSKSNPFAVSTALPMHVRTTEMQTYDPTGACSGLSQPDKHTKSKSKAKPKPSRNRSFWETMTGSELGSRGGVSVIEEGPNHQVLVGSAGVRGSDVTLDHLDADGAKRITFLEVDSSDEVDKAKAPSLTRTESS